MLFTTQSAEVIMRESIKGWRTPFVGLLVLLLPQAMPAQNPEFLRGGGGFIGMGVRTIDVADLNSTLRRFDYPTFQQHMLAFGGGGYALRGRVLIGGEGYGLSGQREDRADGTYSTRLTGGFGTLNIGYLAAHSERITVYPLIGAGGAGVQLDIAERGSPTFEQVLEFPGRSSKLATGSFLVTLSIAADFQLTARPRPARRTSGMVGGLRVGYSNSLTSGEWTRHDGLAAAGPDVGLNGFFVTFTFGARTLRGVTAF
jgi:hypothetical protein